MLKIFKKLLGSKVDSKEIEEKISVSSDNILLPKYVPSYFNVYSKDFPEGKLIEGVYVGDDCFVFDKGVLYHNSKEVVFKRPSTLSETVQGLLEDYKNDYCLPFFYIQDL